MKININSFADAGNFQKERVIFKVEADVELGLYAVFCTALSSSGKATAGRKTAYWFPDGAVKKDDLIVLYTKCGNSSTKELSGGRTAHFFYWGGDQAMWGNGGNGAVLLHASEWAVRSSSSDS